MAKNNQNSAEIPRRRPFNLIAFGAAYRFEVRETKVIVDKDSGEDVGIKITIRHPGGNLETLGTDLVTHLWGLLQESEPAAPSAIEAAAAMIDPAPPRPTGRTVNSAHQRGPGADPDEGEPPAGPLQAT